MSLTASGRELLPACRQGIRVMEADLLALLDAVGAVTAVRALARLVKLTSPCPR